MWLEFLQGIHRLCKALKGGSWPHGSFGDLVEAGSADFRTHQEVHHSVGQPGAEGLAASLLRLCTCCVLSFIFVCQVLKIKCIELLISHHAFPLRTSINKHVVYFLNCSLKCSLEEGRVYMSEQNKTTKHASLQIPATVSRMLFLSSLSSLSWGCYEVRLLTHR